MYLNNSWNLFQEVQAIAARGTDPDSLSKIQYVDACRTVFQKTHQKTLCEKALGEFETLKHAGSDDDVRFLPLFSVIFNSKMQKLPLFPCILIRNEGKNRTNARLNGRKKTPEKEFRSRCVNVSFVASVSKNNTSSITPKINISINTFSGTW